MEEFWRHLINILVKSQLPFLYFLNPYNNYLPHLFYKFLQLLIATSHWHYTYFEIFFSGKLIQTSYFNLFYLWISMWNNNCSGFGMPFYGLSWQLHPFICLGLLDSLSTWWQEIIFTTKYNYHHRIWISYFDIVNQR